MTALLTRPELELMPLYNAGLGAAAVQARYGVERIVKLASNENPHGASPLVAAALIAQAGATHAYPDASCAPLREALAERLGVEAGRLIVGNGSEHLLELIAQAFLTPGSRVLTVAPCFGLHEIYPLMMGAQVEKIPVTAAMEFDLPAWRAALAQGARAVFLPNPSNPVGCMLGGEAFAALIAATPADTLLVIDEAYYEYAVREAGFPDALAMLQAQSRPWLLLRTFSKAYGLAGLRVGYGVASAAGIISALMKVRTPFAVNAAAQAAALAALQDEPHLAEGVTRTIAGRAALRAALLARGLVVAPSAGNFLFVRTAQKATAVAEALLRQGVIIKPWTEAGYENWLRVSIGTAEEQGLFLSALDKALQEEA